MINRITVICLALVLAGFGCNKGSSDKPVELPPEQQHQELQDSVKISANIERALFLDGELVLQNVSTNVDSWVVVYKSVNGTPQIPLAYHPLAAGSHQVLNYEWLEGEGEVFILLHEDSGEKEKFEFPLADLPSASSKALLVKRN